MDPSRLIPACTGRLLTVLVLLSATCLPVGCETGGQTGALAGGGIGALIGQAAGGDTKATLVGAAIGTGIGYIIGNEGDKQKAKDMSNRTAATAYVHQEIQPLAGTRWTVVSLVPRDRVPAFTSKVIEFRADSRVITTTTETNGAVILTNENYRVVGETLIVNKPGYIINAEFDISGNQLIVAGEDFRAVLARLGS